MDNKKYSIFRMRNGGGGNRVIFPETHADAVHTTKNRKFVTETQLETINSLTGSPLLDYNSDEQKTKFDKVFELADNAKNIQILMNNLSIDEIKEMENKLNILQPLISQNVISNIFGIINNQNKYDLAVVPGDDGQYYTMSVQKTVGEDGVETFKEIYTPYEPSTTNPLLGSLYTPQNYEAETEWVVPVGAENIKIQIPLTYCVLVTDNSIVNGQIDLWSTIQSASIDNKISYQELTDNSFINGNLTCNQIANSKPYLWMTWNLKEYLKPIIIQLYGFDELTTDEEIESKYNIIKTNIVNFKEKISYRPIDATATISYQPFIGNNYYTAHVEQNGDNTMMVSQEISPSDLNMSYNAVDTNLLLNGESETIASILTSTEQGSFEFSQPILEIEFVNPFVGQTLVSNKANDHFDLADWTIKK